MYVGFQQQSAAGGTEAWFEDSVLWMPFVYSRYKADAFVYALKEGG